MGLLGFFKGKEGEDNENPEQQQPNQESEQPQDGRGDQKPGQGPQMKQQAEDIISQLEQINTILDEEGTGNAGLSDVVNEGAQAPSPDSEQIKPDAPELRTASGPPPAQAQAQAAQGAQSGSPADTISIDAGDILPLVPAEYLAAPAEELQSQFAGNPDFAFSFNRTDVMLGLSQGKLEFTLGDLVSRTPLPLFSPEANNAMGDSLTLPLDKVVSRIPPEWFKMQNQDTSREAIVEEMDDLFDFDLGLDQPEDVTGGTIEVTPEPEAAPPPEPEPAPAEAAAPPPAEPEAQPQPEEEEEEEEPVQRNPYRKRPFATVQGDTVLLDPVVVLELIPENCLLLTKGEILDQVGGELTFTLQKQEILQAMSAGKLLLPLNQLFLKFSFELFNEQGGQDTTPIALPLQEIVPHLPPEWYAVPGQDQSPSEVLQGMDDIFGGDQQGTSDSQQLQQDEQAPVQEAAPLGPSDSQTFRAAAEPPIAEPEEPVAEEVPIAQPEEPVAEEVPIAEPVEPAAAEEPVAEEVPIAQPEEPVVEEVPIAEPEEPAATEEPVAEEVPAEPEEAPETVVAEDETAIAEPEEPAVEEAVSEEVPIAEPEVPAEEPETEAAEAPEAATETPSAIPAEEAEDRPIDASDRETAETFKLPRGTEGLEEPKVTVPPPEGRHVPELNTETQTFPVGDQEAAERAAKVRATDMVEDVTADEVKSIGEEVFERDEELIGRQTVGESVVVETPDIEWRSAAPNGININRSGVEQLCLLPSVGPHLAGLIIDHRHKNGPFGSLRDLREITGLGAKTFQDMTGISTRTDLKSAELRLNRTLGLSEESISLSQVASVALKKFDLAACFVGSSDGLILAKAADDTKLGVFADSFSAVSPQLYKRAKKALAQASLPEADMFTFFLGKHAVTFAGADQVYCAMVHKGEFPAQRQLRGSRKFVNQLVWYCSYRAVV